MFFVLLGLKFRHWGPVALSAARGAGQGLPTGEVGALNASPELLLRVA